MPKHDPETLLRRKNDILRRHISELQAHRVRAELDCDILALALDPKFVRGAIAKRLRISRRRVDMAFDMPAVRKGR
jgi:hypothetical protein